MHDGRGDLAEAPAVVGLGGVEAGGDALAAQHLDGTGRGAVTLRDVDGTPAVGEPALGVGEGACGVAPVRLGGAHAQLEGVGGQFLVGGERGHRPPHHAQLTGPVTDVGDAPQGGRAHVDGRLAAAGPGGPRRLEELLAGGDQIGGAGTDPLGVADQGHRTLGQDVEDQLHVVDEDWGQRLHAFDGDALGDLAEHVGQLRVHLGEGGGPLPYLRGQQQLTAGRGPQSVLGDFEGPLVGDLEVADLLDVVAPELHPQRVLLGGREDVEDAAAYGELAALLDQFDAGVRGGCQRLRHLVEIGGAAAAQRHGLQVAQALDLRLEHGTDGRDNHTDRAGAGVVGAGVRETAQHGEPAAHGVAARRQALVRQRLPGRELHDGVGGQQRPQRGGQVLGLPVGRGDGEYGAPGVPRERGDDEGPGGGRPDQIDVRPVPVGGGTDRFGERRVSYNGVEQTVQAHEGASVRVRGVGGVVWGWAVSGVGSGVCGCSGVRGVAGAGGRGCVRVVGGGNAKGPTRRTGRGFQRTTPEGWASHGTGGSGWRDGDFGEKAPHIDVALCNRRR